MSSLRDRVLAQKEEPFEHFPREPVTADGGELWAPGEAFIRLMSATDSDFYEASRVIISVGPDGKPSATAAVANIRARLLVLCLCDATGALHFTRDDALALGAALDRNAANEMFDQASRLNKLQKADRDDAKNSPAGSDLPTGSPSPAESGTSTACSG
jgi:hypothetical protein